VFMVMKTISEALTLLACDIKDLNHLQNKLKETLKGKKLLLVLDDVWDRNPTKWEVLSKAIKSMGQESKVVVTTRDSKVARVMHASTIYPVEKLLEKYCLSLFAKFTFPIGNFDAYTELQAIGTQIV
jgi:hypothetical protein